MAMRMNAVVSSSGVYALNEAGRAGRAPYLTEELPLLLLRRVEARLSAFSLSLAACFLESTIAPCRKDFKGCSQTRSHQVSGWRNVLLWKAVFVGLVCLTEHEANRTLSYHYGLPEKCSIEAHDSLPSSTFARIHWALIFKENVHSTRIEGQENFKHLQPLVLKT